MPNLLPHHVMPVERAKRRSLKTKLLAHSSAILLVAPGLAQAQVEPSISASPSFSSKSLPQIRARAYETTRNGQWVEASAAWKEVLRLQNGVDSEASEQLAEVLSHLQSDPSNYEGLVRTRTTVTVQNAPKAPAIDSLQTRTIVNAAESPRAVTASRVTASRVTASRSSAAIAPASTTPRRLLAQGEIMPPAAPSIPAPVISAPSAPLPLPAPPSARAVSAPVRAPRAIPRSTPPALAPLPAATNVTAIPFRLPARRAGSTPATRAAQAWPLVNRAAKELAAGRNANALSLYRKAYALDPRNEYAGPGVATVLVIQNKFNDAVLTYLNYLAFKPNDFKALRGLADAYTYSEKLRQAIGVNNYILSKKPNDYVSLYQNGQLLTYLRSYKSADTYFARASKIQPTNPALWTSWGESLSYRRDPRAVTYFNRAASLRPTYTRATLGLGNYYSYVGDFSSAIPAYRKVLNREPRNVTALLGLGDALTYSDQPEAAVAQYRAALQVESRNNAARLGLGRALVYAGRSSEGARELKVALASDPGNASALEALAIAQTEISPREAIGSYQTLLRTEKSPAARARLYAGIGDLYAGNNDFPNAIQSYSQASSLAPRDPKINLAYAQLLTYQDMWSQARQPTENVLAVAPGNPRALALQVQIESKTGNSEKAQQLAANLENVNVDSAEEALQLADALREVGSSDSAQRILENAATKTTDSATAIRLANAVRDGNDYPTAISIYRRVLTTEPNNVDARIGLAQTYVYSRELPSARAEIQRVLSIAPNNQDAQLVQANLNLAQDTPASRDDAGKIAVDVLRTDPNNSQARVTVGQVFSSRGRFAEAVNQFRIAVASQPNNVEARLGLARNLYYSRDIEGAITEYRELIRRTPADTLPRLELAQLYLDRNRFSDAEALYNEVLALRRGANALSSVRRAIETRSLARLNPMSRLGSPLRTKTAVRLQAKRKLVVNNPKAKRKFLAQLDTSNGVPAASIPAIPAPSGALGTPQPSAPEFSAPEPSIVVPSAPSTTDPLAPLTTPDAALTPVSSDRATALRGLGEIRRRQQRYTEANDYFTQAIGVDPNDIVARVGLAQSLRSQSNYSRALEEVGKAVAIDANSIPARVVRAQLLSDTGDAAGAKQELDTLLDSIPENAPLDTYIALANALNTLQNYDASLQLVDVAAQLYPTDPSPVRLKAETLTFARRYDEALAIYDKMIAADSQDVDSVIGKARVYSYSNRLPEAETVYRQALETQPNNYQAQIELADVVGRRSNYAQSIALYQEAIASNPTDLATQVEMAKVQRYSGATADAETTLNKVLDVDSRYTPALVERGILRGSLGSYDTGIADLQAALAISPTDLNAQIGLAEVQSYAGQYEQSIKGYQAVLVRDPQNLQARTQLGLVLSYTGRNTEALKEIDTALTQNPGDIAARLARADILARSNRTAEAVSAYNTILAADPNNVSAKTGLADAYLYGRRYDDAVRIYDGLIKSEPTNSNYKIQRARALGYAGRSKESYNSLRALVAAEPNNLPAKLALAEVGINSGDGNLQKAGIAQYRAILAKDPGNGPAKLGLARGLSYVGSYKEAKTNLNQILTASPDNVDARYALAETQRFEGSAFDARDNYNRVLKAQPTNAQAQFGLAETRRSTASSLTLGAGYYSDSNGVRLRTYNVGPTLRTRALTIGAIVERGKFSQNGVDRDRKNDGIVLGKQFGQVSANLAISRLRYEGAPSRTLFDGNLLLTKGARERYYAGVGRRDVFESDAAVTQGITADIYRAGFAYPLASRIDLEGQVNYYRYSDDNTRFTLLPALYYRFKPTNPSLRVGVGYTYDDTDENRPIPGGILYYTPQKYSSASILADYVVDQGPTRYGLFGALALTGSTGDGGVNRPADTLFGNFEHDLSNQFSIFANGGIVRSSEYRSNQVNGGVNLRF